MLTCLADNTLMPVRETGTPTPVPLISSPLSATLSVAVALITIAFVPDTSTPPSTAVQSIVSDLVMVTPPKPPESMQLISPPLAVLEIAPAKVLHGAVRLHGLASSPTPETQVRVACAEAGETNDNADTAPAINAPKIMRFMRTSPMLGRRRPLHTSCVKATIARPQYTRIEARCSGRLILIGCKKNLWPAEPY